MIENICKITNVGKFEHYIHSSGMEFDEKNLIYGENGTGKTTLVSIFRSLKTGDEHFIHERKRLGTSDDPDVAIKYDDDTYQFDGNEWNDRIPNIEIFDSHFVNSNIYTGDTVELDHQKRLFEFIIGEEGIKSKEELNEIETKIEYLNETIRKIKSSLEEKIEGEMSVDVFADLESESEIVEKIESKKEEIERVQQAEKIAEKETLPTIELPSIDIDKIKEHLKLTVEDISTDSLERAKEHFERMGENGEQWIETGLDFVHDESCPFCGEDTLTDNSLLESFNQYFSEEYEKLKNKIRLLKNNVSEYKSGDSLLGIQEEINNYNSLKDFWEELLEEEEFLEFEFKNMKEKIISLVDQILSHLNKKLSSPLEQISLDQDAEECISNYQELVEIIGQKNSRIEEINKSIKGLKNETEDVDIEELKTELNKLINIKIRYESETIYQCKGFIQACNLKQLRENEKAEKRDELDNYTEKIFSEYQEEINKYLRHSGADFRVVDTEPYHRGSQPSSRYQIELLDEQIDPRDRQYDQTRPTFKTVLSSGDKNTLAFAFFLAKLRGINLADMIIVVDDPISSMDVHRSQKTRQILRRISDQAKQLILFSHYPRFLFRFWKNTSKEDRKAFKIYPSGSDESDISKWNIKKENTHEYVRMVDELNKFLDEGSGNDDECRNLARYIRSVLEHNIRVRYPLDIPPSFNLGKILGKIQDSNKGDRLNALKEHYDLIDDLNQYSRKYHHSDNNNAGSEPITESTLRTNAEMTISFIKGDVEDG